MSAVAATLLTTGTLFAQLSILTVSPNQADPGTSGLTVSFTLPDTTPPTPPAGILPDSVTIGSINGSSITHSSLATVTAVFNIPASEVEGVKDCVVSFTTPQGTMALTKIGGFTVGTPPSGGGSSFTNGPPASGYNLFNPMTSKTAYLMDNDENVIKSWTSSYNPGLSLYLLDNGSLLRTASTGSSTFNTGGAAGRVEVFSWEGNLTWSFDYDSVSHRTHHDVEMLPNGNILLVAWELKSQSEAEAAGRNPGLISDNELWPDHIIEIEPNGNSGGTIVWEWHVWDHLVQDYNASAPNYGVVADHPEKIDMNYVMSGPAGGGADWNHINAIDYNAEYDQILVSVRNFSEIWVIDHNTTTEDASGSAGDLLYRWGNPAAYDSGGISDQQLFVQHNAQWIDEGLVGEGNILIFNNGQGRPDGDYSSVVEIVPPVAGDGTYTAGLPLAPTWVYTNSVTTNFYASRISGAQRLKNGNTLICEGTEGYAFEVTTDGDLVWEYTGSGEMFRFERYAPDFAGFVRTELALPNKSYAVVDTFQTGFYGDSAEISEPGAGTPFFGQDGTYQGNQPCYEVSPDGLTVYDYVTGLTWTRSHDWDGDGDLDDADDKKTQAQAVAYAATLNAQGFGGYSDWRLPSTKEIYSLMNFLGTDPDPAATDGSGLTPFIDTEYFDIGVGDLDAGDRIIDSQFATTTIYVDAVMNGQEAMFGLNLVDGRIKGYPTQTGKGYYAYYCRGNTDYGINDYTDNGNGTVTDHATGLMWQQLDSAVGMDWADALAYAEALELGGYRDWRLPNAKELQSILDYTRAPGITASAAINPLFTCTQITNMAGEDDYPWYWSGTTHLKYTGSAASGVYICFGRGTGTMDEGVTIIDVHGAGCQRSDPKTGDPSDYPNAGNGPQGDVQRVFNFVRCVRGGATGPQSDSDDDGLTDAYEFNYTGSTTGMSATADSDEDGVSNGDEEKAGTIPTDGTSVFKLSALELGVGGKTISWTSELDRSYTLEGCANLNEAVWHNLGTFETTPPLNSVIHNNNEPSYFYRVKVE